MILLILIRLVMANTERIKMKITTQIPLRLQLITKKDVFFKF